jgi:hypothetical protein
MPFHVFLAEAIEIAQDGFAVRRAYHFPIRFEEPWHRVCPLAERPWTSRLHKNLTKKKIPHGSAKKSEYRFMFRPHEPFFGNNRTRFAVGLIHMPVCVPWNSASGLTKNWSGVREIGRKCNVNLEAIEDLRIVHDRKAAPNIDGAPLQHYAKVRKFRRDLRFQRSE